jgi:hypothetical protein
MSEKYDIPKRVEIKELELCLKQLLEFKDMEKLKLKNYVCRELAFIIKDL